MDVESFAEGILGSIVVPEGGVAGVGNPIAFIAETEADLEAAKAKAGGGERGVLSSSQGRGGLGRDGGGRIWRQPRREEECR